MNENTQNGLDCASAKVVVTEVPAGLTRRAALTAFAAAFATIGLNSISESAYAAAKTYKICKTTDVKVGSARMFSVGGRGVVVTQPKKGVFKAFNANCTHQGAPLAPKVGAVRTVSGSMICPQHGAGFDTTTGAVTRGPAAAPLDKVTAKVSGTQVSVSF
jgi:nitrite reductase/ring-hydroxylating ferredoxin subunit